MPSPALPFRFSCKSLGIALLALALTACAQTRSPDYYASSRDNTESDARMHAQGRSTSRAPSQIQLGFGDHEGPRPMAGEAPAAQAQAAQRVRPLTEAKTFLGTVPCLTNEGGDCPAMRITLTLAPTGEWRARTHYLNSAATLPDTVQQGCWEVIGSQPTRILLSVGKEGNQADLSFQNDNVLVINMLNNIQPKLEYRLTRQANIDPIDELAGNAPLACS
ncbi:copper resistance protein NlpE N-terminal domain-containing protein [Allopusillimonas ginsengisoli]|uniref:copper resistance protein NlpE N-terminal domain-containing protein n=1 Tax=Allopusillimonas ginsengisoli TaxID=453575 RepID=UPI00101FBBD8|nr:copper resistance protein NlpE N-terminal domain-containing protein [Allopusillimonas ginsengisoli]TEA78284.1 hypothetical protein ERE07_10785 [Allopusillimonas ginsengisoli]